MFETLETFDTEISADSVEWCPIENYENIFVCGTYELESQETRVGRMYLFKVVKTDKIAMKLLQQLAGPGILDMKWAHVRCFDKTLLGVVRFTGLLEIYELTETSGEGVELKLVTSSSIKDSAEEGQVIALSLDWSTGRKEKNDNTEVKITVSDSRGNISLFKLRSERHLDKISTWPAHEFEAWITAFDYWNTNILYTGGDDGKFLSFDTRTELAKPTTTNRSHEAGVTSFHSNWKKEFYLVSGSYDENLRTWDTRHLRRPVDQINVGGGIWRLKWDPYEAEYLLVAGMYAGFFVVDAKDANKPTIVARYSEHTSIAYGSDWSYLNNNSSMKSQLLQEDETSARLIATCSFYDHCLKLSSLRLTD